MLGQRLPESTGLVGDRVLAELAAGDRGWVTVTRKRREDNLFISLSDASLATVILIRGCPHALHAP
jgi:hypothetical protein